MADYKDPRNSAHGIDLYSNQVILEGNQSTIRVPHTICKTQLNALIDPLGLLVSFLVPLLAVLKSILMDDEEGSLAPNWMRLEPMLANTLNAHMPTPLAYTRDIHMKFGPTSGIITYLHYFIPAETHCGWPKRALDTQTP
jgi:hypothetical protein